jgi:dipeptidyl aminopeptidase/acylaminoacyl peptidase
MHSHRSLGAIVSVLALLSGLSLVGCGQQSARQPPAASEGTDLAAARSHFATKLKRRGPAPQSYQPAVPPAGVRVVEFQSGNLRLKGWLSAEPPGGTRSPAVVFLHGGWAFAPEDWRDAAPFAKAGFLLFMPMLRAENGNQGAYEGFYGEVDDAVAAGRFVASLPSVDPSRMFVAGHSVGAVLTVLAGMLPSPYRAGAALSGYLDMESWVQRPDEAEHIVFDARDSEELRLRNPMAFVPSLRIPLVLYTEPVMQSVNEPFASRATELGKKCELVVVPGNHQTMVAPSVKRAIEQFRAYAGK